MGQLETNQLGFGVAGRGSEFGKDVWMFWKMFPIYVLVWVIDFELHTMDGSSMVYLYLNISSTDMFAFSVLCLSLLPLRLVA